VATRTVPLVTYVGRLLERRSCPDLTVPAPLFGVDEQPVVRLWAEYTLTRVDATA